MDIILDSNIIRKDLKFHDKGYEILSDYLAKTNSKYVLPKIVIDEVQGLYKRALNERLDEYSKNRAKLKSTLLFVEMPDDPVIDFEADSNRYIEYLHNKLGTTEANIVPYKNEYLPELVSRAIQRKKPLDNKGQQFRDGILWLTLLDYAETTEEKVVAFISDNSTDFSDKGENKLTQELIDEAATRGIEIKYFRSLNEFAKEHASTIEYINAEWLEGNIDFGVVDDMFKGILGTTQEESILDDLDLEKNETSTGYINGTDYIKSWLSDFFVYEKRDGTILLNVEFEFETEYEIEIERTIEKDNSRYDYVYRENPITGPEMEMVYIPDYVHEKESDYKFEYPQFIGKFVLSIKDGKIENYELKDWDWA